MMSIRASRIGSLLAMVTALAIGLGATAGCGGESGNDQDAGASAKRARQVADAWDGSPAADSWRAGYYPMGEAVQLPQGGLRSEVDKRAYETQNFILRGELPDSPQKGGRVTWASGGSLTLPLLRAQQAYAALARGSGSDKGPHLTVTGAKLGEMTLATSRGPASVPAWLFTVDGYSSPLKRAAVRPSKLSRPPIRPADQSDGSPLMPLDRLIRMGGDGRTVTVNAHHGGCDEGPVVDVWETRGSVVLSASVKGQDDGLCTDELHSKQVTVQLTRPLGERVLLDARTGLPVPYGKPKEYSPSWS